MPLKMLLHYPIKISRVGNLIMVDWSLKYVATKSILCFVSINAKTTSHLCKKSKSKF